MKQETTERYIHILRKYLDTDTGETIVAKMMAGMSEKDASKLADELEDMMAFQDYLTEAEAKAVVSKFENFDGSRGCHWRDAQAMFDVVSTYGIDTEMEGHYNRWAWYATMNMVWSDEWGVLRNYVSNSDEAKVVAELTRAKLLDRDSAYSVRWYFHLDEDE